MPVNTVKEVRIKNAGGTYDSQPVGAEGQYVEISRDANGDIIEDITAAGVTVDSTQSVSKALKDLEGEVSGLGADDVAYSNSSSGLTATDVQAAVDEVDENVDSLEEALYNITDQIAPVEISTTASQDYAVDDKFFYENTLYICTSAITIGDTIEPGTNCSVADKVEKQIDDIKTSLINNINYNGCKNLVPSESETITKTGITFTRNSDGSYTVSGTNSSSENPVILFVNSITPVLLKANTTYKLSGAVNSNLRLDIMKNLGGSTYYDADGNAVYSNSGTKTFTNGETDQIIYVRMRVHQGATVNGTIKPMLRLASDLDKTYVPFAKTNRQLTEDSVSWIQETLTGKINFLNNTSNSNQIMNNVSMIVNTDKSVTISKTDDQPISENCYFDIARMFILPKGQYNLRGDQSLEVEGIYIYIYVDGTYYISTKEKGVEFILNQDTVVTRVRVYIKAGSDLSTPITFYPMIVPAGYNGSYTPYGMGKEEIKGLTNNQYMNGAVNLLNPVNAYSTTQYGVTFDVKEDGRIIVDGTATGHNAQLTLANLKDVIPNGQYRLSGCPSGGSEDTYFIFVNTSGETSSARSRDIGEGTTFNYINDSSNTIYIRIIEGVTVSNLEFRPMLTVGDMPNSNYEHYVPYTKTNQELSKVVDKIEDGMALVELVNVATGTGSKTRQAKLQEIATNLQTLISGLASDEYIRMRYMVVGTTSRFVPVGPSFQSVTGTVTGGGLAWQLSQVRFDPDVPCQYLSNIIISTTLAENYYHYTTIDANGTAFTDNTSGTTKDKYTLYLEKWKHNL